MAAVRIEIFPAESAATNTERRKKMKAFSSHARLDANGNREDKGFTLVEILIAIVLVGILSAVVVVGISNLTSKGSESACKASADAAKAGSIVYYSTNGYQYPKSIAEMVKTDPAALTLPDGVVLSDDGLVAVGDGWKMSMSSSGGGAPTFTCG
jgi:prepilin-type N-terminal cleavage/methylation domain-containing protein